MAVARLRLFAGSLDREVGVDGCAARAARMELEMHVGWTPGGVAAGAVEGDQLTRLDPLADGGGVAGQVGVVVLGAVVTQQVQRGTAQTVAGLPTNDPI